MHYKFRCVEWFVDKLGVVILFDLLGAGSGSNLHWRVVISGQSSLWMASGLSYIVVDRPVIRTIEPTQVSTQGGDILRISGENFRPNQLALVQVGEKRCEITKHDRDLIECVVAEGLICLYFIYTLFECD